nr:hypothetical protein [Moorena sp. SIO3E8]
MTTAQLSTEFCGYIEQVHRGETYLGIMASGKASPPGFTDGVKTGIWNQILENLQAIADHRGNLDWEVH